MGVPFKFEELEELKKRQALSLQMGGADKLARQKARGKLNARERLEGLLDFDGFDEIGGLAGKGRYTENGEFIDSAPSNFIYGRGRINDRPVVATADDFTVRGGASDAAIYRKFIVAEQMAHELRLPIIPMVPGWDHVVKNLETVPVVALALGPTAGLGAARAVASHYSVMVKGLSQIFTAGPAVVAALGEEQDKESLGGSKIHTRNGVIDDEAADEAEAFDRARKFLSYLPDYAGAPLVRIKTKDSPTRRGATITAFARLDGWPVAVLANDPTFLGGSWTANTAEKAKRFVELAELFGLPVINLVDNPGFMIGLEAEKTATIRRGVEAMNGIYRATVPWASVIIRKAYGVAGAAMSNAERFPYRVAWPSGDWGSLPIDGGVEVAYRAELVAADDPAAELAKIKARLANVSSPFRTTEAFGVENIIDPRDTRAWLCEFIGLVMR